MEAICAEIKLKRNYLGDAYIDSIYFGGGTPSVLSGSSISTILKAIRGHFHVRKQAEITFEVNPDDLSAEYLRVLVECGINRISIGIQTFDPGRLTFMNRSHLASQSHGALTLIKQSGIKNYSADLIFAVPPEHDSHEVFQDDLTKLLAYQPEHISIYGLTIEEQTVFGKWQDRGKLEVVSEEGNAMQYELASKMLAAAGYQHYEVSNFALPGFESKHNSSYWKGETYLGLGPSAASFDGISRSINLANNAHYLKAIEKGIVPSEIETLTDQERYHDYMLTGLRTCWGVNLDQLTQKFDPSFRQTHGELMDKLVAGDLAKIENKNFILTEKGFALADAITLQFFSKE